MARTFNWNLDAERELWAAICAPNRWHGPEGSVVTHPDSLWWFIHMAWGSEWFFRAGERRWLTHTIHQPYLRWLQSKRLEWQQSRRAGRNIRFQVATIIPRGFGKTVSTTKAGSLWIHLDEPDMRTNIFSEVRDKAVDMLGSIKKVMAGEDPHAWFPWLYGVWKNPERDWLKLCCVHGYRRALALQEPSFDTSGVDTGMTGYHPLDVECDDPVSANKLREGGNWMSVVHVAVNAIYPALQTDGWLGLTLTRYLDDDVAGRHLRDEGVAEWAGMPPPNSTYFEKVPLGKGVWFVYFLQAEDADGNPILPQVMDTESIRRAKARDAIEYSRDYMNDPGTGEHMPLTEDQIKAMKIDRAKLRSEIPIAHATLHFDTAFKDETTVREGDDSVIVVWLHDARPNGLIYFDRAIGSNEWRDEHFMDEVVKVLLDLRRRGIRVKCITDEVETGGKRNSFKNHLIATIRGAGLPIPRIKSFPRQGTQKGKRIRTAAGFWADGYVRLLVPTDANNVFIDAAVPGLTKLVNQMLRVGIATHDDYADAAADVWADEVWTKPTFETWATAPDIGLPVMQSGDDALKSFSKPLNTEQVRALYDEQFDNDGLRGPEDAWLSPREPV